MRAHFLGIAIALSARALLGIDTSSIHSVAVSKPFFNPTVGQTVDVSFTTAVDGTLSVAILDRDGFLVRTLVPAKLVERGGHAFTWDGRNERGDVVPDEAYSLKIDLERGGRLVATYFPANTPGEKVQVEPSYYNRPTAVFAYKLPKAARVHMQAGITAKDLKTGKSDGPVLKTLVNREPKPAGAVVENWNGLDETGTYYLPDLPGFVMAVAATALPENSVILFGNSKVKFIDQVAKRQGISLFTYQAAVADHRHHGGLSTLDDVSPELKASVAQATWSEAEKAWITASTTVTGTLSLEGPSAQAFSRQPAKLYIYVDEKRVAELKSPTDGMTFSVQLDRVPRDKVCIVAFDWASDYGPASATSARIKRLEPTQLGAETGRR